MPLFTDPPLTPIDLGNGVRIRAGLPTMLRLTAVLPDYRQGKPKVVALPGPAGPPGTNGAVVVDVTTPAATWTIPHSLGRLPGVAVYDASGDEVLAQVHADATQVVVVWASPTAGSVVLT